MLSFSDHLVPCHHLLIKQIAFYFRSPMDACVCLNLFCIYSGLFIFNRGLNACSFFIIICFISNNKQTFDLTTINTFAFVHGIIICICLFACFFTIHHQVASCDLLSFEARPWLCIKFSNHCMFLIHIYFNFVFFFGVVFLSFIACTSGRYWFSKGKPASWACQDSR